MPYKDNLQAALARAEAAEKETVLLRGRVRKVAKMKFLEWIRQLLLDQRDTIQICVIATAVLLGGWFLFTNVRGCQERNTAKCVQFCKTTELTSYETIDGSDCNCGRRVLTPTTLKRLLKEAKSK